MSKVTTAAKTLGEQMWDLLVRNPENYDVTFSVGLEKKEVKAVKFLLKAASWVFQKQFQDKWEKAVMKDGQGIPLPDVDPSAFQLMIKLLIQDTWSVEVLKSLNLTPNTLLSLLGICCRFEIKKAIQNLGKEVDRLLRSFVKFKDTDEFLKLTQSNLAALLSSGNIPVEEKDIFHCACRSFVEFKDTEECLQLTQSNLAVLLSSGNIQLEEKDIFNCACRWAAFQCSQKELEETGENIRAVLGQALFEIRFPAMSVTDFAKVARNKSSLLKAEKKLAVFEFIGLEAVERLKFDELQARFKTHPRNCTQPKLGFSALSLTKNLQIHDSPPFVCNGRRKENLIQISNGKIALHGIGFFGPVLADSHYDVEIEIRKWMGFEGKHSSMNGKLFKRLFARKKEIFYFIFDAPVVLDPIKDESTWNCGENYTIYFTLKGPDTMAVERNEGLQEPLEEGGIKFRFYWDSGRNYVAEYLFKKL